MKKNLSKFFSGFYRAMALWMVVFLWHVPVDAGVYYVDQSATSGSNNGSSWTDAYLRLSDALQFLNGQTGIDTVFIAQGYYYPTGLQAATNRDSSFVIMRGGIKMYGGYPSGGGVRDVAVNQTVLSGNINASTDVADNSYHVLVVAGIGSAADSIIVDGFTIRDGMASGPLQDTINGVVVVDWMGGGVLIADAGTSRLLFRQCQVIRNATSSNGGGVFVDNSKARFVDCAIRYNKAGLEGGGLAIVNSASSVYLYESALELNTAMDQGGGVMKYGGYLEADRVNFRGNRVTTQVASQGNGGAFFNADGQYRITNSVFSGNRSYWGSALYFYDNSNAGGQVINCTIAGNYTYPVAGGAIACSGTSTQEQNELLNCVIWGNNSDFLGGQTIKWCIASLSAFSFGYMCLNQDPLFRNPVPPSLAPNVLGDYRLRHCSPAIDYANNYLLPGGLVRDLDDQTRIIGPKVDVGSYEFPFPVSSPGTVVKWFVDEDASGANSGTSWADAYTDLQLAINSSCPGDTIWVAEGVYTPEWTADSLYILNPVNRSNAYVLRSGLKIFGGFAGNETALSERDWLTNLTILSGELQQDSDPANNAYHVVIGADLDASTVLDGFIVEGGNANQAGSIAIDGETIYRDRGAGSYFASGGPQLYNLIYQHNSAVAGGAGIHLDASNAALRHVTLRNNLADSIGGGLWVDGGTPVMNEVGIRFNSAVLGGGVFAGGGASLRVTNSVFEANTAQTGGAWYNRLAEVRVTGGLFRGNKVTNKGSAWYFETNDSVWLVNTTFAGNEADFNGGGVIYMDNASSFPAVHLQNSIVWNNSSTLVGGLTLSHSIVQGGSAGGWDWDPVFVDPAPFSGAPDTLGDYHLTECSPAIDAGDNSLLPATFNQDLDHLSRIFGSTVDLGTYEFQELPFDNSVLYVDSSVAVSGDGSSWANALKLLSDAFALAASCPAVDTILVAKGTYYPTGDPSIVDREVSFSVVNRGLKVFGGFEPGGGSRDVTAFPSILSGDIGISGAGADNSYHVLAIIAKNGSGDSVVIDGFTVQQGRADGSGATFFDGSSIAQDKGGGIVVAGDTLSRIRLNDLRVYTNYAIRGGGIYNSGSNAFFSRVTVAGNSSDQQGGGIYCNDSKPHFINVLVKGNVSGNDGAGFYVLGADPLLINTTIAGNHTTGDGAAIFATASSSPRIKNTVISGNTSGVSGGIDSISYSLVQGLAGGSSGNLPGSLDPLFVAPEPPGVANVSGDYHLQPCSPLIDMGSNNALPATTVTDLDDSTRIVNSVVDIGAFEVQHVLQLHDTIHATICFSDTFIFNGTAYSSSGIYADTLISVSGCDSIAALDLTVLPAPDTVVFQSLDSCGQVTFAGQVFTGDTVLYDTLQYANIDCDSLYAQVNIIVHAPSESVLDTTICEGAWVNLGGQVFDTTGVFVVNLETVDGCDSIITLHLAVNPQYMIVLRRRFVKAAAIISTDKY